MATAMPPYQSGDQILITGVDANGNSVSASLNVDGTTTMGDLINSINGAFTGATASLDSAGNLVLAAKNTGPANLSLTLADASTNTGQTQFSSHTMATTTVGQDGATVPTAIQVFDPQGTAHTLTLVFQKQADNTWNLTASINPKEGTMIDSQVTGIKFNDDGSFSQVTGTGVGDSKMSFQIAGMSQPQVINLSFGSPGGFSGLTQFGGATSAAAVAQDGYSAGVLSALSIGRDGVITGTFSNGHALPIAQLALATFTDPDGLDRQGSNYFAVTNASGLANVGTAASGNRGYLQSGTLEQSNVDVSLEFTRLITALRGFQANARTIRVSDEVLQDLVSIIQ